MPNMLKLIHLFGLSAAVRAEVTKPAEIFSANPNPEDSISFVQISSARLPPRDSGLQSEPDVTDVRAHRRLSRDLTRIFRQMHQDFVRILITDNMFDSND